MKILFLTPYPIYQAPSQRFRFEFYLDDLLTHGHTYHFSPFLSSTAWKNLYQQGRTTLKLFGMAAGILSRFYHIVLAVRFDVVFIHREAAPLGPPVFEWFIAKVLRKKIIYDFDDAIWMNDGHDGNPLWTWLKWRSKVATICSWSWKVSVGNEYLADFARPYNQHVFVNPTVVDTEKHKPHQNRRKNQLPTIGWTGSHSTLFYLNELLPVLQQLEKEIDFQFLVIANKNPELPLRNFQFIPWNETTEVEDLAQIDIGIMPLENTEWAKGKCGFKLIQYGAMGIPSVAAPVGTNKQVVINGETGLFAGKPEEWKTTLKTMLLAPEIRQKMGTAARKHIISRYSVRANKENWLSLFD